MAQDSRALSTTPLLYSCFDPVARAPMWVQHVLRMENFRYFSSYPYNLRWKHFGDSKLAGNGAVFRNASIDRGHLLPYADLKSSQRIAAMTFNVVNRVPYASILNQHSWACLEMLLRHFSRFRHPDEPLIVVTGALQDAKNPIRATEDGQDGQEIGVPTFMWKLVLLPQEKMGISKDVRSMFTLVAANNGDDAAVVPRAHSPWNKKYVPAAVRQYFEELLQPWFKRRYSSSSYVSSLASEFNHFIDFGLKPSGSRDWSHKCRDILLHPHEECNPKESYVLHHLLKMQKLESKDAYHKYLVYADGFQCAKSCKMPRANVSIAIEIKTQILSPFTLLTIKRLFYKCARKSSSTSSGCSGPFVLKTKKEIEGIETQNWKIVTDIQALCVHKKSYMKKKRF